MSKERIDKIISSQGTLTRRGAGDMIKKGAVCVNGTVVLSPAFKVDIENDEIKISGTVFSFSKYIYIMLNKPDGIVSASRDGSVPTVVDLVPDNLKRNGLFPAGRLDKDTTGFVLVTDDGGFAHQILSPKNHIEKTYEALLDGKVTEKIIGNFEKGIVLGDGTVCLTAQVTVLNDSSTLAEIKICEGKYHQIKRMFASQGLTVLSLKRTAMGKLPLDEKLKGGECRLITDEELTLITEK